MRVTNTHKHEHVNIYIKYMDILWKKEELLFSTVVLFNYCTWTCTAQNNAFSYQFNSFFSFFSFFNQYNYKNIKENRTEPSVSSTKYKRIEIENQFAIIV